MFEKAFIPKKMTTVPRLDLNPSAASRWVSCTASPRFILANADKLPPDDTEWNQEGTTAHEVNAALLEGRPINLKECPTPVTKEMHKHAWDFMEYVQALAAPQRDLQPDGARVIVETKFPLWYNPSRNGKVDVLVSGPVHTHIIDYKYGQGVIVDPYENLQGAIYARSALRSGITGAQGIDGSLMDAPVSIHIYQPRGRGAEDSPSHVWETTWAELLEFTEQITKAAELILADGETQFAPSDQACRFCPANTMVEGDEPGTMKKLCPALHQNLLRNLAVLPPLGKKMHFPPAQSLSVKQMTAILEYGKEIKEFVDDVKTYALEHLKSGGNLEGWKLVKGRQGDRYWTDPAKAAVLLLKETHLRETEVWEKSVVGPAGVEKLLGKNKLSLDLLNLVARAEGKPTIAPVADKRPEYGGIDAKSEFEALG